MYNEEKRNSYEKFMNAETRVKGIEADCRKALEKAITAAATAQHASSEAASALSIARSAKQLGTAALGVGARQDTRVKDISTELEGLYKFIEEFCTAQHATRSASPGKTTELDASDYKQELQALKRDVYERIGQMEQAARGVGRVQLGNVVFDGTLKSYEDQIRKWGLTKVVIYEWLLDPVSAQCLPHGLTRYTEDHTTQAILTLKTEKSQQALAVAASYESTIPEIYNPKNTADKSTTTASKFTGIKTFDKWDAGDEENGLKILIECSVEEHLEHLPVQIENLFGSEFPEFALWLNTLHTKAFEVVLEFCKVLSELFKHLLVQSYGTSNTYNKAQEQECWDFALVFAGVYYSQMHSVRTCAKNIEAHISDPIRCNALALKAACEACQIHQEFKTANFREHSKIFPMFQTHFIKKCVRKTDLVALKSDYKELRADVDDVMEDQGTMKQAHNALAATVGRSCNVPVGDKAELKETAKERRRRKRKKEVNDKGEAD
jgi:hypothetical protein